MIDRATIKAAALCMYLITYSMWPFLWKGCFYQGLAIAIALHWISELVPLHRLVLQEKISVCGLLCAVNNLLDELFFDPRAFQVNEYVLLFLLVLIVVRGKRVQIV